VLLSGHFDPYQTLIASEMSSFPTTPQARLVLSEAFSAIELFAGAMALNTLPAFQEFPISNVLWILLMGSFLGLVLLWHHFEGTWFDSADCDSLDKRGMVWVIHYFATYIVMYAISLISYELTMLVNGLLVFLSRINGLLGILFLVVLAIPLGLLYVLCLSTAFRWLKYMLICLIPLGILDHFFSLDTLFLAELDLTTIFRQPWILLGLLVMLIFERICVEYIMMDDD